MLVKILIVDDQEVFRNGLFRVFNKEKFGKIVGSVWGGREAIKRALISKPDVVLMDLTLPDISGMYTTKKISENLPNTKIIGMSHLEEKISMIKMYEAGAVGCIEKESSYEEFIRAINIVRSGYYYIPTSLANYAAGIFSGKQSEKIKKRTLLDTLTPSEMETLMFLVKGNSSQGIAKKMNISTKTVSYNRRNVMKKMQSRTFSDLLKRAIKLGLTGLTKED
ncbi:MAG: response regulator transcription factor [Ignavibacteriales bacterium]|nr:response regulator transcription factor [Ignavibacteriales bacterium]